MSLDNLRGDLLYLVVFGPGYGESIVVHAPPDTWLVVDGCTVDGDSPVRRLLADSDAAWSCVVLTHPHRDHARGLDMVLAGRGGGPIGCADPRVDDPGRWARSTDPEVHLDYGAVEQVMAVIHDRWTSDPNCRWLLRRGDRRTIGDLGLRVLHPSEGDVTEYQAGDPNRLASALEVTWKGVRLLLGSDVVYDDWEAIHGEFGSLAGHHALKFPHHGSIGSCHSTYGDGASGRTWIVTPFASGRLLPRFGDGQGVEWMLKHEAVILLTGLPVAYDFQGRTPYETTRQDLRDGRQPRPLVETLPGGTLLARAPATMGTARCYIAAGFVENGELADVRHGAGSVLVREGGSAS